MSRLRELRRAKPGILGRIVYFLSRRRLGRVPEPVKVLHQNGAILAGVGALETAFDRATLTPPRLKSLAQLAVAMQVGCPF